MCVDVAGDKNNTYSQIVMIILPFEAAVVVRVLCLTCHCVMFSFSFIILLRCYVCATAATDDVYPAAKGVVDGRVGVSCDWTDPSKFGMYSDPASADPCSCSHGHVQVTVISNIVV